MSLTILDKASLIIDGRSVNGAYADLAAALVEVRVRETITGASTLTLKVVDPKGTIRNSGLLAAKVTAVIDGAGFELVRTDRSTRADLTITFEDMAVAALRRRNSYRKVAAGAMSRAAFCQLLIREEPWITVSAAPGALSKVELARGSAASTTTEEPAGGSGGFGTKGLDPAAAKAIILGSASASKSSTSKKTEVEDTWDACGRIMGEIGWRAYALRKQVVLAPDSWILSRGTPYALSESSPGLDSIGWEFDTGQPAATATLRVRCGTSTTFPAGSRVTLSGEGPADGDWLVETIDRTDRTQVADVTLIRPSPALPEPTVNALSANPGEGGWGTSGDESGGGQIVGSTGAAAPSALVEAFVQKALAQAGKQYVWGATGPGSFDCSGLVMWCAAQVGGTGSPTSTARVPYFGRTVGNQLALARSAGTLMSVEAAIATRGALLIRGPDGHIAISLGGGKTIEAKGRAYGVGVFSARGRGWTTGAWVPGITVSASSSRDGRAS